MMFLILTRRSILYQLITVGQFVYVVRKRIKLGAEKAIVVFVKNTLPPTVKSQIMLTLYGQERSRDAASNRQDETPETSVRDIHALTPVAPDGISRTTPLPPPPAFRGYFSPTRPTTATSEGASSGENFTTISRDFISLVMAGSSMGNNEPASRDVMQRDDDRQNDLTRIHEERDEEEETNPLAISSDQYLCSDLDPGSEHGSGEAQGEGRTGTVQGVKREEVEAKITAWQTAKLAKINNRFKREEAVINGWVKEQVHKANSWMKKIEVNSFVFV